MKTRKNIYLFLGILFLLFYMLTILLFLTQWKEMLRPNSGGFGFFMTGQLWAIPPVLFFRAAYRLKKKIDRKNRELLEIAFTDSPTQQ